MAFLDFFKPKWKHSNPEVRQEAAKHLGDPLILGRIAREDPDAKVRRAALRRVVDPGLLRQVADHDPDDALRRLAAEALIDAARGQDQPAADAALAQLGAQRDLAEVARKAALPLLRQAALARVTEERLLCDIAKNAEDADLRRQAAERVRDPALLRDIAVLAPGKELAGLAIERLKDPDLLEDVSRRGQSKGVRAAARDKLAALTVEAVASGAPLPMSAEARLKRRQKLVRQVEVAAQLKAGDWDRAADEIERAQKEWAELGAIAAEHDKERDLQGRFDKAVAQYEARKADLLRRMRAEKEAQAQRAAESQRHAEEVVTRERQKYQEDQRVATRATLCEQVGALQVDALPQGVEQARAAWELLEPLGGPTGAQWQRRFERACEDALRLLHREAARQQARTRLQMLVSEAEVLPMEEAQIGKTAGRLSGLEKEFQDLWPRAAGQAGGPELDELRARLGQVGERLREARKLVVEQRHGALLVNQRKLEELCVELEGLAATDLLKEAQKRLKEVDAAAERVGPLPREGMAVKARLREARQRLVGRLQELREAEDWRRWAAVPRLEALCARAEALAEPPAEGAEPRPAGALPKELRALQGEWRAIGPGPRERAQALRERFGVAVQKLEQRCQDYFQAQDAARGDNLKRKEELCARVEAVKDSGEWKETTELVKQLQGEWKAIGPVPKEQSDALWKRFRGACDHYFGRLKEHAGQIDEERQDNQRRQEELCAKVEGLAMSADWKRAGDEIKALQAEWKEVGPAPKEQADALWKRFRGACDQFFERRKVHYAELDQERQGNLVKKEALCATVEGMLVEEHEESEAAELVRQYMGEWKSIGPVPKDQSDSIWERFRVACDKLRQQNWEPPPVHEEGFSNRLPLEGIAEKLRETIKES